jgi:uncharacterized Zn-binding protein involved in type VI secretion
MPFTPGDEYRVERWRHAYSARGTGTAASNEGIVDGMPVARKGDTVECKEHGTQTIGERDEASMVNGSPVALQGHLRHAVARW